MAFMKFERLPNQKIKRFSFDIVFRFLVPKIYKLDLGQIKIHGSL